MGVKDYDLNPDNNTQINGINIAEGCPPSGINNAVRQLMADVKADSDAQNKKASTPASGSNLGPVKVGSGLSADKNGLLTVAVDGKTTKLEGGKVVAMDVAIGGDTADLASGRGQIGNPYPMGSDQDLNKYIVSGCYFVNSSGTTPLPEAGKGGVVVIYRQTASFIKQIFYVYNTDGVYTRHTINGGETWSEWIKLISETDSDGFVQTTGNQTISGQKINTTQNAWAIQRNELERGSGGTASAGGTFCVYDKNKKYIGAIDIWMNSGNTLVSMYAQNGMNAEDTSRSAISVYFNKDGTKFGTCPTPPATSDTNSIATTEWVRDNAIPVGFIIPSFAASRSGYLLCNGAAVSRTTYADLFGIIGTKFGAGDGTTTFNLPDFRNKTFWGADGNLMAKIEAGLPNATAKSSNLFHVGSTDISSGAFYQISMSGGFNSVDYSQNDRVYRFGLDLSKSNAIYGRSTTVQPPAIAMNFFIKY